MEIAVQTDSVDGEAVSNSAKEVSSLHVPLVRNQLRSAEMLDAVRIHRQGGWIVASDYKPVSKGPCSLRLGWSVLSNLRCRLEMRDN